MKAFITSTCDISVRQYIYSKREGGIRGPFKSRGTAPFLVALRVHREKLSKRWGRNLGLAWGIRGSTMPRGDPRDILG